MEIMNIKKVNNENIWNQIRRFGAYTYSNGLIVVDVSREELSNPYGTFSAVVREILKANGELFPECYDILDPSLPDNYAESFDEETDEYQVFLVSQDDHKCVEFYTTGVYPDFLFCFDLGYRLPYGMREC